MNQLKQALWLTAIATPCFAVLAYNDYQERELERNPVVMGSEYAHIKSVRINTILPDQLTCIAENAYHEARGEKELGMIAVTNVVLNRAKDSRFPNNPCAVVYQPNQFSWVGKMSEINDEQSYKVAESIAKKALNGKLKDITANADHYHATYVKPDWSKKMAHTKTIGKHKFYNAKAQPTNAQPTKQQEQPKKPITVTKLASAK